MTLKYPERQSEGVLFRENFISEDYFAKNNWTKFNAPSVDNGMVLDGSTQYISSPLPVVPKGDFTVRVEFTPDTAIGIQGIWGQYNIADLGRLAMYSIDGNLFLRIGAIVDSDIGGYVAGVKQRLTITRSGSTANVYKGNSTTPVATVSNGVDIEQDENFLVGLVGSSEFDGEVHFVEVIDRATSAQEHIDWIEADTFTEIDASKAVLFLPCRSHFGDGSNEVTSNLGTGGNFKYGDGSTTSTYPAQLNPNGLSLDGGDYLSAADNTVGDVTTGDFSTGMLFKVDNGATQRLVWKDDGSVGYRLYLDGNGYLSIFPRDGVSSLDLRTTGTSFADGVYHHVVYVHNKSNNKAYIYVDGVAVTSGSLAAVGSLTNTDTLLIGAQTGGAAGFTGELHYPFLFNSTLTPTQIKELSNQAFNSLNV